MATSLGRTVEHADGNRSVVVDLTLDTSEFEEALRRFAEFCRQWAPTSRRPGLRRVDAHHPRPLGIDGAAYRRRTLARRRRNR